MQCALCRAFLPLPTYFLLWSSSTFSPSTPTLGLCRSYNYHIIILAINHHSIKVSYLFYLSINKLIDDPTMNQMKNQNRKKRLKSFRSLWAEWWLISSSSPSYTSLFSSHSLVVSCDNIFHVVVSYYWANCSAVFLLFFTLVFVLKQLTNTNIRIAETSQLRWPIS